MARMCMPVRQRATKAKTKVGISNIGFFMGFNNHKHDLVLIKSVDTYPKIIIFMYKYKNGNFVDVCRMDSGRDESGGWRWRWRGLL